MTNAIKKKGYDDCQLNRDEIKLLILPMEEKVQEENCDEMKILVESMVEKLEEVSSLLSNYDIYRVPMQLQRVNPDTYTPLSVSIGPLHYNKEHLRTMETHKLRYLKRFLNPPFQKTLDDYVEAMSNLEERARKCYSETMGMVKNEFVKMMVMDGCFILGFLDNIESGANDHFISNVSWYEEIKIDLIKLENQLPFFVLEHLDGLIFPRLPGQYTFSHHIYANLLSSFAKGFHGPTLGSEEQIKSLQLPKGETKHFLHLLHCVLVPPVPSSPVTRRRWKCGEKILPLKYCASELRSAGVKFQKEEMSSDHSPPKKTSLFDITFDMEKGILTIPTIMIDDSTEIILRNLISFEQGQKYCTKYFTAYAYFMSGLIDTPSDVKLLEQKGIITNHLCNTEDIVTLFGNIGKYVTLDARYPYFYGVIKDLEDYHNKSWNKSKASLMQKYFNTPWASISVGAAALLLIFTIIQTTCSILQVKP
ncbi:putative UPF0481 protein At3g02645 [Macadamia integrifolia]|uniref:putative UPF0481 protein At3g02645 n=1 Tax=Macadamia integrifolia TaxID=60698 RepID=UPI001C4FB83D|nr:putative UPF0481 protein At3g02645 [Macadamia integrifolia]XP_042509554.1 putative UPF0481 protein At3g02645 [Macadamia integrifolia]XP_042509555.1 putative UPF0481 protein At3g02645 [Macadamia integrifolia]